MKPKFFATPADWRTWLEAHHATVKELWVGFYKKGSGIPSITWPESVDGALCFGWIDGIRKSVDDASYVIRFTPRRSGSIWSAVNVKRTRQLIKLGLMHPAGLKVFEGRIEEKSNRYSYEQRRHPKLTDAYAKKLKANKKAWAFFQAQPPGYQRTATWWVMSAKKEETRLKRLATLIEDSERERRIGPLAYPAQSKK